MSNPKFDWQTPVVVRMDQIVEEHNALIADLVECLAEIEDDEVHLEMGYTSLYAFCRERYAMSEGAALRRIRAARVARRHPSIIGSLRCGELSLEAIAVIAPYVDDDPELLRRAATMSVRDVRAMVAARHPDPNAPRGAWSVRPVGDGLFELKIVVTKDQLAKLEHARDLDRHRNPSGDMAHTVEAAADALIAQQKKKRFAITASPQPKTPPPATVVDDGTVVNDGTVVDDGTVVNDGATTSSTTSTTTSTAHPRRFPAAARRAIAERDTFQCAFVAADGTRCTATAYLELDHRDPHALGGASTADNGRILCAPHNRYEARRLLGPVQRR